MRRRPECKSQIWSGRASCTPTARPVWLPYVEVDQIEESTDHARQLGASVLLAPGVAGERAIEADVVIKGATLIDGTGKPGVVGDLAINGDRIVAVGKFEVAGNPRVLDAELLLACYRRGIFPMAVCVMAGTRFAGLPMGSSPIRMEG